MHVGAALIPNAESTKAIEPRPGVLDDPAMTSQVRLRLDADARNPAADAVRVEEASAVRFVGACVRVHLHWPAPWMSALPERPGEERDRVEHVLEPHRIVHVRGGQERGERNALGIDHHMALRARFRAIRRIRPGRLAPRFAGILIESTAARLQSI